MKKIFGISRNNLMFAGVFLALMLVTSATAPKAHAALVLDPPTASLLSSTLSATGNLMSAVQNKINAGDFSASQSIIMSEILGGIGNTMANISAMIGGIGLPNTGEAPSGF